MKYYKTKHLMWTDITVTTFWEHNSSEDIDNVFLIFKSLELEFSRFLPDSSLSILNKNRTLEASDRFIDVIKKCKQIYADTNLYFNPLINLNQIGYSKSFDLNEFEKEKIDVNICFDKLDIRWNNIVLQENQTLDLWGIVKWYWVDLAKNYLDTKSYKNYIINAWWDIYVSWANEDWKKLLIWIENPFTKWELLATIELENKAIATSGNYRRKWTIENQEYNHIINPITWSNNNEITSITLISDFSYISDAYATACIAMWLGKTLEFLEQKNIDWLIVCADKNIYGVELMRKYNLKLI